MKFSIIIPVYNAGRFLTRCLDSISRQTFRDFEVIAVNDGSTDNSLETLNDFARRVGGGNRLAIKIITQSNHGVSAARNNGLDNASGDWVLFVDSDDYLASDALEKYNQALNDYHDPELIVSNYKIIRSNRRFYVKFWRAKELNVVKAVDKLDYTYNNSIAFLWHKIYRRDIIESIDLRFDTEFSFGEDSLFNIMYLSKISKVHFIKAETYHYCDDNPNSLVKQKYPIDSTLRLLKKYLDLLEPSSNSGVVKYTLRLLFRTMVRNASQLGESELSIIRPSIVKILPFIMEKQPSDVTDTLSLFTNTSSNKNVFNQMKTIVRKDKLKHLLSDMYARVIDKIHNLLTEK